MPWAGACHGARPAPAALLLAGWWDGRVDAGSCPDQSTVQPTHTDTPATQDIPQIAIAKMPSYFTPRSEHSHFCVLQLQVPSMSLTNTLQMLLVLS